MPSSFPLPRRFAVIGATGAMGHIVVQDLAWSNPQNEIVFIGHNPKKLSELCRSYKIKHTCVPPLDVTNIAVLVRAIRRCSVAINCVQDTFNLHIMKACLRAGVHYIDLGGLFHMTRKQLKLHTQFAKAGLLAVLGMGAAPGTVNLLAKMAAEKLDTVSEVHIRIGFSDRSTYTVTSPLSSSYSFETIFREFSYPPAVFTKGKWRFVEPMSGFEDHNFPAPVGKQRTMYTLHSEVVTLPLSFRKKGIRDVSFKIAFDPDFAQKVRFLQAIGMTSEKPIKIGRVKVIPRDFLIAMLKTLPQPVRKGKPKEHEVLRVIVKGTKGRRKKTIIADCHVTGMPQWGMGVDIDTGVPPSIVAQMIVDGKIPQRGCLPPEQCVPVQPFFQELQKRRMFVQLAVT